MLKSARCLGQLFFVAVLVSSCRFAQAQDRIRTGTGLGQTKIRVALADFGPRAANTKPHASLFTQVVRDDLQFSGILELASPSFYPTQAPTVPAELKAPAWIAQPTNASYLGFGNLTESTAEVNIQAWLFDVRNPTKLSANLPAANRASLPRRSLSFAPLATETRKSGSWIMTALISTS